MLYNYCNYLVLNKPHILNKENILLFGNITFLLYMKLIKYLSVSSEILNRLHKIF